MTTITDPRAAAAERVRVLLISKFPRMSQHDCDFLLSLYEDRQLRKENDELREQLKRACELAEAARVAEGEMRLVLESTEHKYDEQRAELERLRNEVRRLEMREVMDRRDYEAAVAAARAAASAEARRDLVKELREYADVHKHVSTHTVDRPVSFTGMHKGIAFELDQLADRLDRERGAEAGDGARVPSNEECGTGKP